MGAKDDPATWAIAQTIRGEAAAMTAASDSLSRGQSLADVATAGASQISDLLSQFRAKWLSFSDPSISASDRKALQSDLQSLLKQVDLVAQDSSFDGATPLLAMTSDASTTYGPDTETLTETTPATIDATPPSFGSVQGHQVDQSQTFDVDGGPTAGQVNLSIDLATLPDSVEVWQGTTRVAATGQPAAADGAAVGPATPQSGEANLAFDYDPSKGQDLQVRVDQGSPDSTWSIGSMSLTAPNPAPQTTSTVTAPVPHTTYTYNSYDFLQSATTSQTIPVDHRDLTASGLGLADIDYTDPPADTLQTIDQALQSATSAASYYGEQSNAFSGLLQQASQRQDALTTGAGQLTDADVAQVSANLQAAQIKQQLATQALSIANATPQLLLSLFNAR